MRDSDEGWAQNAKKNVCRKSYANELQMEMRIPLGIGLEDTVLKTTGRNFSLPPWRWEGRVKSGRVINLERKFQGTMERKHQQGRRWLHGHQSKVEQGKDTWKLFSSFLHKENMFKNESSE